MVKTGRITRVRLETNPYGSGGESVIRLTFSTDQGGHYEGYIDPEVNIPFDYPGQLEERHAEAVIEIVPAYPQDRGVVKRARVIRVFD